ncbi:protein rolling stone-like [Patiria miniata]|uniref:Rolling stone n=1 Tax=Patiria miniata TaxID=46514 RepID=A0A914A415_PATMI|nr:protein rolling stone-like [Patiria miniata]
MEALRSEFRWQKFGFGGVSVKAFVSPQFLWSQHQSLFIAFRVLVAVYQLAWNITVPIIWGHPSFYRRAVDNQAKWLIYLSNWSFCVLTLYLVTAAVSLVAHRRQTQRQVADVNELVIGPLENGAILNNQPQLEENTPLPWYFKLTWLLQNIAYSACAFVTAGYWLVEFQPGFTIVQIFTIHVHGISLIIALADLIVAAPPIRLLHFVYPYSYFLLYQLFALIYYKSGGTNPYGGTHIYKSFIDWENAPTTSLIILLLGTVAAAPCLHGLLFALDKLRNKVAEKCCAT